MKSEFLLAFFGLLLLLKSIFFRTRIRWHDYIEIFLGIAIFGCSLYTAHSNSVQTDKLQEGIDTLSSKRNIDSTNNSNFQKYLKDSLGIKVVDITNNKVTFTNKYYQTIKRDSPSIIKKVPELVDDKPQMRHASPADISRVKSKIEKDYVITINYNRLDVEVNEYALSLQLALQKNGYKVIMHGGRGMIGTDYHPRFNLVAEPATRTAYLVINSID